MKSALPPSSPSSAGAPRPACAHCLALAADPRRREPHACLALRSTAPLVSQSAAGVPFSMMTFTCRECGTTWRLYDRANELFVSWVPEQPLAPASPRGPAGASGVSGASGASDPPDPGASGSA